MLYREEEYCDILRKRERERNMDTTVYLTMVSRGTLRSFGLRQGGGNLAERGAAGQEVMHMRHHGSYEQGIKSQLTRAFAEILEVCCAH